MEVFPAVVGHIGTWRYYATRMKPRPLFKTVSFAEDLWPNSQMDEALQRALNKGRAKSGIAKYLSRTPDRFFSSIVIAAMEGRPTFYPLQLADDPAMRMLQGSDIDDAIGILRFTDSVKYYALDGQHRLAAIRALLENETEFPVPPGFENEEIPVIIVVQKEGEDRGTFVKKYRRLFGNLNRWAKPVDEATNIVLDEDDAFAIVTRRLLQEHSFFARVPGDSFKRIRIEGSASMRDDEPYFMTLVGLYAFNEELLSSPRRADKAAKDELKKFRLEEDDLDALAKQLSIVWDVVLEVFPELKTEATQMRSSKVEPFEREGQVCQPHVWFRPIGQMLMARLIRELINSVAEDQESPTEQELRRAIGTAASLPRLLGDAPFRHLLFVPVDVTRDSWKMRSEDRKQAQQTALEVLRFMTGLQPHDSEQLVTLKESWRGSLVDARPEEIESMWEQIIEGERRCRDQ